jgi:hypothetical protein
MEVGKERDIEEREEREERERERRVEGNSSKMGDTTGDIFYIYSRFTISFVYIQVCTKHYFILS